MSGNGGNINGNRGNTNGNGNARGGPGLGMWNQIEKLIGDKLSFMNPAGNAAAQFMQHPDWVQDIVKQAFTSVFQGGLPKSGISSSKAPKAATAISTEVFETHRQVITKIKLPPKEHPRSIQVLVRSDRIKLLGLPGGEPAFIGLPAPVVATSARALYREGILEVYARKRKKGTYHEAYVEY